MQNCLIDFYALGFYYAELLGWTNDTSFTSIQHLIDKVGASVDGVMSAVGVCTQAYNDDIP